MSKSQRDKGQRREREVVKLHLGIGVHAERVPLSGAARYQGNRGDVDAYAFGRDAAPLIGEVKARGSGEGFVTLARWLGENDLLWLIADRAKPLVVMPWETYVRLIGQRRPGETSSAECLPQASEPDEPR